MQLDLTAIIVAIITAAIGGGGGFYVALRRLKSDNKQHLADSIQAANEAVAERWRELVEAHVAEIARLRERQDAQEKEIENLRQKLAKTEYLLDQTKRELLRTARALQTEQERNTALELVLASIEKERDEAKDRWLAMASRVEELERKGNR
jgi:cell division protein FtsB